MDDRARGRGCDGAARNAQDNYVKIVSGDISWEKCRLSIGSGTGPLGMCFEAGAMTGTSDVSTENSK